jgi:predicted N-acetyltransferase YhbS
MVNKSSSPPTVRKLQRKELPDIWSIDRREFIRRIYRLIEGKLALEDHNFDVPGWPPGDPERESPGFLDCFDRGGSFFGAFAGTSLVGVSILESRLIGVRKDQLQLKFLHVSRDYRGSGVGSMLFERTVARAVEIGVRTLYISATPSENTIQFYLSRGCRVAREVDPELYEIAPDDIHLEFALD